MCNTIRTAIFFQTNQVFLKLNKSEQSFLYFIGLFDVTNFLEKKATNQWTVSDYD